MEFNWTVFLLLCLIFEHCCSEKLGSSDIKWIRSHHNPGWTGPILESKQPGNVLTVSGKIKIAKDKCCPFMFLGDDFGSVLHQLEVFCLGNMSKSIDIFIDWVSDFYKLDWNYNPYTYKWNCQPVDDRNYICLIHQITELKLRVDTIGKLYIFYPCLNRQPVDILHNLTFQAKNVSDTTHQESRCLPLEAGRDCTKYYSGSALPNALGQSRRKKALKGMGFMHGIFSTTCHKHFEEVLCHLLLPKCENQNQILLCKLSCFEVLGECGKQIILKVDGNHIDQFILGLLGDIGAIQAILNSFIEYMCNQLPVTECIQTPRVTCPVPTPIENGQHNISNGTHYVNSIGQYECKSGYRLDSNGTVTCEYSGSWSRPPKCLLQTSNKDLIIVCSVFGGLIFVLIVAVLLIWKYRQELAALLYVKYGIKFIREREESRRYDAYIAYNQNDIDFVKQKLVDPLERIHFKLCVPERDFEPGDFKSQAIIKGVQASKRTIIVLSQNFIESTWCQFQFAQAHLQLLKDESFKLLLIAIDDPKNLTLKDAPKLISEYINSRTYLLKDDALFWEKLVYKMPAQKKV